MADRRLNEPCPVMRESMPCLWSDRYLSGNDLMRTCMRIGCDRLIKVGAVASKGDAFTAREQLESYLEDREMASLRHRYGPLKTIASEAAKAAVTAAVTAFFTFVVAHQTDIENAVGGLIFGG